MKVKRRITAAVLLVAMMMGQAMIPGKAAEKADKEIYHYFYQDYSDAASVIKGAQITRESNNLNWQNGISPSWGSPTQTMVGTQKGVWWFASSKSIQNTSKPASNPANYVKNTVEQNFATVHLDQDGSQAGAADSVVELILDYGVLLSGIGNGTPYMKVPVTGVDSEGGGRILAMLVMNGTGLYFEGAPQSRQEFLPKVSINGNKPGQRSYIKILFDMRSQTYSAYY